MFKSPGSREQSGEQHRPDEGSGQFFGSWCSQVFITL